MVTQERECPNALIQITAVRPALNQVGRIIMEEHIETCVAETFKEGKEDKAIAELKEALRKFI
ncbi:MAG: Copper-sensing transcriptional repressor CsoR [candidate division WS2 bacterium]|uniref:Copper-sensing transcriptional repressor CsoR n=1 Tax=Psychracetigena formicireducens TaxID=2986056 RepID=A0A9E2F2P2_PSYF1|nr:Copper-sensing transcriptional repressor CsoR [Candidatus Psychracetigena formicireducens]MBT9145887.1 Copper-sensing transcriptional repressor CsoR [Candidatus Psychracetigena formicireducens]MBT9151244.1 Copper-sensing transcriptional repressor CsoR [Candidatus Psychracetigena formicireducens]